MTLWDRIHRVLFGAPEEGQTEEVLSIPMKKTQVQLTICKVNYRDGPVASVRYTTYAEDGKPLAVEQINYGGSAEQLLIFDTEATTALEMGVDVSIFTRVDVDMFPQLSQYTKR